MLNISQSILNKIANEPTVEYQLTIDLFGQDQETIDKKLEELSYKFIPEFYTRSPDYPVESLVLWYLEVLPLNLDSKAIGEHTEALSVLFLFCLFSFWIGNKLLLP